MTLLALSSIIAQDIGKMSDIEKVHDGGLQTVYTKEPEKMSAGRYILTARTISLATMAHKIWSDTSRLASHR